MTAMPYADPEKGRERHRQYMREVWYPKNRIKHIGYIKRLKQKVWDYISEYKKHQGCVDCGFKNEEYPEILEFDHLKDKKFDISMFFKFTTSVEVVKREIEKCELVCANCHRVRTAKRRKGKLDPWFVYILECKDGSLYTGITNDLSRRLEAHIDGVGAKYTKSHPVRACVYTEECDSRSSALKREAEIKRLKKADKVILIRSNTADIEK